MESKAHEWQIPLKTVVCLLTDTQKDRTVIVYTENGAKHKQIFFETYDQEGIFETFTNLCQMSNQEAVIQTLDDYNALIRAEKQGVTPKAKKRISIFKKGSKEGAEDAKSSSGEEEDDSN